MEILEPHPPSAETRQPCGEPSMALHAYRPTCPERWSLPRRCGQASTIHRYSGDLH
jgi:hypothetical protein